MLMKKETFDSVLRSTWQVVSKMYNKEAGKFDSTMAMGFALLSIDQRVLHLQLLDQKWEWNQRVFQGFLTQWKTES